MLDRPTRVAARACIAVALALFLPAAARADDPDGIPWRTDFERAVAEGESVGRPVWAQFTGPWCLFCRRMDHEVLSRPDVSARARESFVPVKVRSDERADLVERFGITGLPATILIGSGGRILARHEGYAAAGELVAMLDASRPAPAVALDGFDPVSLVGGDGLEPGRPDLAVRYDGLEYRFADRKARETFLEAPERFLPTARGRCPVGLVERGDQVAGDPRFGVYYRGRLYLCADETARRQFAADPDRFADADLAENGNCPHCRRLAGRLVRGRPQFAATHAGRRYLFPDLHHLEAFRASPEEFLRR